jgi:hypothetical protein
MGSAISPLAVGHVYGGTHSVVLAALTLAVGPVIGLVAMLFVSKRIVQI